MLNVYIARINIYSGGGMFDENQNQQTQGDHADYSKLFDNTMPVGAPAGPAPGAPVGPLTDNTAPALPQSAPFAAPAQQDEPIHEPDLIPANTPPHVDNELLGIKQDALHELAPLVDQLDQTAEERFRTTMMLIQASDDQSLVRLAYDEEKKIEDEKLRAQALLDVVNEINYFTQQNSSS